ncbi:MAG: hypothetical protein HYY20_02810 [Candidatus Tectomicrobia bacterium]|uniref:Uncharacterized protein n=1 Tax=Tectimicrobiota bacterium TaxID=2528274 RepID=A0A932CMC7_UNCTE|nr:hypothetical protein [Candidatus Tectomicrobia bacterium]
MDPTQLIGPPSPLGYPAPYWFLVLFKVLGFTLHLGPMNLWYAGTILAMLLHWRGREHARRLSARLMNQMPIILSLGINFGIVPLLFLRVAYYRVFYPATILMAWPWFSIVLLLTLAYYGVYLYVIGLRRARLTPLKQVAGWVAALSFLAIGFLFPNGLSLMAHVGEWPALWQATSVAGAPTGMALNTADSTLWPRWLMMFGLALTTTAAYTVMDAGLFAGREGESYRRWVPGFALKLYALGVAWFMLTGAWLVLGTWLARERQMLFSGPLGTLTGVAILSFALPGLLIRVQRRGVTWTLALLTGLAQFGVLAQFAIVRQVVQNVELSPFLDVTAEPVHTQWSTLLLFLGLFVVGLGVVIWMLSKAVAAERRPVAP